MSRGPKRPHAEAVAEAERFIALFERCYQRWQIAGSVRRCANLVGDIEHVVVPRIIGGVNMMHKRLDELLPTEGLFAQPGTIEKAIRETTGLTCWGPKHRAVAFGGFTHDLFLVDERNWGSRLTIATGPRRFSEHMVTTLRRQGFRHHNGYVRDASMDIESDESIVPCPEEQDFFRMCGSTYIAPEKRGFVMRDKPRIA